MLANKFANRNSRVQLDFLETKIPKLKLNQIKKINKLVKQIQIRLK
jgi:hypothetical protein